VIECINFFERLRLLAFVQPRRFFVLLCFLCFCLTIAKPPPDSVKAASDSSKARLTFSDWRRVSDAPILSPQGNTWESAGTFNPAVIFLPQTLEPAYPDHPAKLVMLYRAQDAAGTSRIGYAESTDGIHFTRRAEPVVSPEADYEKNGGVEDPRLQEIGDTYYLTYTS